MEAKELRIGNIININGCDIVDGIGYGVIQDVAQKNKGLRNEYLNTLTHKPIPLTEDWLLRCGFNYMRNKNEYHNRKINEGAYHLKPVGDIYDHWYFYHKEKMITTNIRYVHQLQNLYFALTQNELEIK